MFVNTGHIVGDGPIRIESLAEFEFPIYIRKAENGALFSGHSGARLISVVNPGQPFSMGFNT